jgi:hypothetical protein
MHFLLLLLLFVPLLVLPLLVLPLQLLLLVPLALLLLLLDEGLVLLDQVLDAEAVVEEGGDLFEYFLGAFAVVVAT